MKHLIVAKYTEDITWTKYAKADQIFIYIKNNESLKNKDNLIYNKLPNVGKESHTYLHHIVENYESLADLNIFVHGHPFDHTPNLLKILKQTSLSEMTKVVKRSCDFGYIPLGTISGIFSTSQPKWDKIHSIYNEVYRPVTLLKLPPEFPATSNAQFIATKDCIKRHSLGLYEHLLKLHYSMHNMPWNMEYFWDFIFRSPINLPCIKLL